MLEERRYLAFSVASAEVASIAPASFVSFGSNWKYLDDGSDQGSRWNSLGFEDSTWSQGEAQLGYGDGDEATTVGYGGNANSKYVTTYFRHSFSVNDPTLFGELELSTIRDDGVALYLNGVELLRDNLPTNAGYNTYASNSIGGSSESTPVTTTLDLSGLTAGTLKSGANILAAEIHQSNLTSSDISFDASLMARSNRYQLTIALDSPVNPLSVEATDVTLDGITPATQSTVLDSQTIRFDLPSLSAASHTAEIASDTIESTIQEGIEAYSHSFSLDAAPQFEVNQPPRLQPGNAPLVGYAGSELDQVDILWQTVSAGSGTQDTFAAASRLAGSNAPWQNALSVTQSSTGVGSRIVHTASIVGLNWNTDYEYRIRHLREGVIVDTYQHSFHTRLPAGDPTPFSFAAYGDSAEGNASGFRQVQARVNEIDPAFAVLLGDNVYSSGSQDGSDLRFDPGINPEATQWIAGHIDYLGLGNHDIVTSSGKPAEDNYSVPIPVAGVNAPAEPPQGERAEHSFSWDYGNVHFVTFDTNSLSSASRLEGLLDWVMADLQASDATWKIVYGHHPVAGVPDKPENPSDNYYQQVVSRLNEASVDLFMVGHSHTFSWTYPLTGEVNGEATFANAPYNAFETNAGVPQLVSGVGGESVRTGSYNQFPFVAAGYTASTARAAENGFAKVDVTASALTVNYVAADDGEVIDAFTITKATDTAPPSAKLIGPEDNGISDYEQSPNSVLVNTNQVDYRLRLSDIGGGIDDSTVTSETVTLTRNGTAQLEGVDYSFSYLPTANEIVLTALDSDFDHGTYLVTVGSGPAPIADLAGNPLATTPVTIRIDTSSSGPRTATFQQGIDSYTGTLDTVLQQNSPNINNAAEPDLRVDGDDPGNTNLKIQSLLRFEDIFGNSPGQIPPDATILTAYLQVDVSNPGDRFQFHRMVQDWSVNDTWNSLGGGVQANNLEAIETFDLLSSGFGSGLATVNVTPSMVAWVAAPASNLGWALLPVDTDGVDFDSAEGNTPPRLIVNYKLPTHSVVGRHVFYNGSAFDGGEAELNENDVEAIAWDKEPLLPGNPASFANYTSYSHGITGVMIELNLPRPLTVGLDDFEFQVGNGTTWAALRTLPQWEVVPGAGTDGSDRISLAWPAGLIVGKWLEINLLSNEHTGLTRDDLFYFGNAPGETGDSNLNAFVDATDFHGARLNPAAFLNPATIDNRYDFDRDKHVNATDLLLIRDHATYLGNSLPLFTPTLSAQNESVQVEEELLTWLSWERRESKKPTKGKLPNNSSVDRSMAEDRYADSVAQLMASLAMPQAQTISEPILRPQQTMKLLDTENAKNVEEFPWLTKMLPP